MKISLSWLKELLNLNNDISDQDIISAIEQLGYEIESIDKKDAVLLSKIKVVKVLSVEKHPNADKLTLCEVTDGKEKTKIVCGAPNVYKDMLTAYIQVGGKIADGTKIEARKVRGIVSNGMLCSAKELGLYDDYKGILEFDESFKLGSTLDKYFSDTIIDISTPANRYNCLGHLGVAKELAIKFNTDIKSKIDTLTSLEIKKLPFFDVRINPEICKRYIAIQISNVNNKIKLPFFITYRLNSLGIRNINPIVDISNYVMLEVGHSVHIFDYNKIEGGKIIVRYAKNGEEILALDGRKYLLDDSIVVIADECKPIAIAGIIGGEESCVDENTTDIVIESAVFNRSKIRLGRKKLNINTEASYRFERGSGWIMCELAALKTYQFILNYCGGEIVKLSDEKDKDYYNDLVSFNKNAIRTDLDFINSLLGVNIEMQSFINVLQQLGCSIKFSADINTSGRVILVVPPLDRQDIKFQADLAEEIARFIGYDKIPLTLPCNIEKTVGKDKEKELETKMISCLNSLGLSQSINYSLCSSKDNETLLNSEKFKISVLNPISSEYTELRMSLFSGLIKNLILNYNNQTENVALFEIGKVFYRNNSNNCEEKHIGVVLHGNQNILSWKQKYIEYDFHCISGIIETLLKFLKIDFIKTLDSSLLDKIELKPVLDKKLFTRVIYYVDKTKANLLGFAGEVNKQSLKIKLPKPVLYAEVYFEEIKKFLKEDIKYSTLPKYPYVNRDICLVVNKEITYPEIEKLIFEFLQSKGFIIDILPKDYYKKDNITSITLSLKLQDKNKTLTDEEINSIIENLLHELNKYGIQLRQK